MIRVCLDPGHGGKDPGAIGRDPCVLRETEVVWSVTTMVRGFLEIGGHEVLTTRRQGEYVGLSERARRANAWGADVFVSIHANAAEDPAASGVEVLHYGSERGAALAGVILSQMPMWEALESFRNRGLKERPRLTVLRKTAMPAALVELPFLSNPEDLEALSKAEIQIAFAAAISEGIAEFAGVQP